MLSRWLTHLRQYFPTLPFKASTQGKAPTVAAARWRAAPVAPRPSAPTVVLVLLKNYSRSLNLKTAINVGIVGYPNVGKSSVISCTQARVNVGATPGVTTVAQTVALDAKVKLIDCPGIVFRRAKSADEEAEVALRNCVKVEQIADPLPAIAAILRKVAGAAARAVRRQRLRRRLRARAAVALKRGKMGKGGAADYQAAARIVLHDWGAGNIRYHTEPPAPAAAVTLVGALATASTCRRRRGRSRRRRPAMARRRRRPAAPAAAAAAPPAADSHKVQPTARWSRRCTAAASAGTPPKAARGGARADLFNSRYNLQVNARSGRSRRPTRRREELADMGS